MKTFLSVLGGLALLTILGAGVVLFLLDQLCAQSGQDLVQCLTTP